MGVIQSPVDYSEVREAILVFHRWAGREQLLPQNLREELHEAVSERDSMRIVREGRGLRAEISPRCRALVANLRAQEQRPS